MTTPDLHQLWQQALSDWQASGLSGAGLLQTRVPSGQCGYVANRTCLTALVLAKGRVIRVFRRDNPLFNFREFKIQS